jgi:hypothetical protein
MPREVVPPLKGVAGVRKKRKGKGKSEGTLVTLETDAGGADIGAEGIYVAVPPDREEDAVRSFGSFTRDLYELEEWLSGCHSRSVWIESTGVYWTPLY